MLFDRIEPIVKVSHNGKLPIAIDNVITGAIDAANKRTNTARTIHRVELDSVPWFEQMLGGYQAVAKKPDNFDAYDHKTDEIVHHVYFREGESYCWERFIKCKELCQIALAEKQNDAMKFRTLKELLTNIAAPYTAVHGVQDQETEVATILDKLGIWAAIEVLFPLEHRLFIQKHDDKELTAMIPHLKTMVEKQERVDVGNVNPPMQDPPNGDDTNPLAWIAMVYRIPYHYVAHALDKTTNQRLLEMARNDVLDRYGPISA
ncbi:MAG: hypothetical protein HQL35_10735 [Alphaproteobacteria bacterium]|nr:hypothetical protein [Alphaproteobacteria bacterium]